MNRNAGVNADNCAVHGRANREMVNYSMSEFVWATTHTNGTGSSKSMPRRTYQCTYPKITGRHLGRHANVNPAHHTVLDGTVARPLANLSAVLRSLDVLQL